MDFQKPKAHRSVFTNNQELKFEDLVLITSRQHHRLTKKQIRQHESMQKNRCVYLFRFHENFDKVPSIIFCGRDE